MMVFAGALIIGKQKTQRCVVTHRLV